MSIFILKTRGLFIRAPSTGEGFSVLSLIIWKNEKIECRSSSKELQKLCQVLDVKLNIKPF